MQVKHTVFLNSTKVMEEPNELIVILLEEQGNYLNVPVLASQLLNLEMRQK